MTLADRLIGLGFRLYIGLGFLFIFAPIITLIVFSFNADRYPSLPWEGFTTKWYGDVLHDSDVIASFTNSLKVGAIVAGISTFLGSTAAYFLNRWEFRGKGVYLGVAVLPPTIPLIILALALRIFFREITLFSETISAVVISHVVIATAFAMGIVRMRLSEMDPALEEAAWNLGAGQWRTIREVVLPQALPAIIAALLITMAVSWDEFVIAWYVSGFDTTLPVQIFNLFQGQVSPRINAIGSLVFLMTVVLVLAATLFAAVFGRKGRRITLRPSAEDDVEPEALSGNPNTMGVAR